MFYLIAILYGSYEYTIIYTFFPLLVSIWIIYIFDYYSVVINIFVQSFGTQNNTLLDIQKWNSLVIDCTQIWQNMSKLYQFTAWRLIYYTLDCSMSLPISGHISFLFCDSVF